MWYLHTQGGDTEKIDFIGQSEDFNVELYESKVNALTPIYYTYPRHLQKGWKPFYPHTTWEYGVLLFQMQLLFVKVKSVLLGILPAHIALLSTCLKWHYYMVFTEMQMLKHVHTVP